MLSSSKFPHASQHRPYLCLQSAHHNNHITFQVLDSVTSHDTTQHDTARPWKPDHHEHWQHTIACKDGDTAVTPHLDEALPYLVFTEGVLDLAGRLVQLSLFGVGQGQLGQVALFLAVGGVEKGRPFGG